MRKHARVLITLVSLVIIVSVIGQRDHQPLWQGKRLEQWLHPEGKPAKHLIVSAEAHDAILQMGTNAIPTALRWISYEPPNQTATSSSISNNPLLGLFQKASTSLKPRLMVDHAALALDAENIFAVLGPSAQPAIAELTHLAATSSDESRLHHCINALSYTGTNAVPALLNLITNTQHEPARCYAISLLPRFQTKALRAVPVLEECQTETNREVASAAATALGQLAVWRAADGPTNDSNKLIGRTP